ISAAIASRKAPSRYLIPLSYAAQFGGVCTLVGTSTNLLVNSLAIQSGREGFTLFEFAPLGVVFVAIGTTYLMLVRNFLLPDLGVPEMDTDGHGGPFMVELLVPEKSLAIGQRARDVVPADAGPVTVLQVIRDGVIQPSRHVELQPGDRLLLRGEWTRIQAVRKQLKLEHDRVARDLEGHAGAERLHAEVMVAPGSHLIGHSLAGMRFGHVYRVRVHGLQRQRAPVRQRLDHMPLAVGDILLVDSTEKALRTLRDDPGLIVLGERAQPRIDARRAWTSA